MSEPESPVYAFLKKPSLTDYPGRLAAVFYFSGCNFRCGFCHNAALLATQRDGLPWTRLETICQDFRHNWIESAVLTGGEPTLNAALPETVDFLRRRGFHVKLDTNGSRPDVLERLLPVLDYVAMDIKCCLERYPSLCGFNDPDRIRACIDLLVAWKKPYEFRTTVAESIHDDAEMQKIGALIRGARRFVLQPFVPRPDLPDPALREQPRTQRQRLVELRNQLRACADEVVCAE